MIRSKRGDDDLTRTYFTGSSKKKKAYLTRNSAKNRRMDDLTRSSKKNKRTYPTRRSTKDKTSCSEGETTGLPISGLMVLYFTLLMFLTVTALSDTHS
jgi:hypothetical protein